MYRRNRLRGAADLRRAREAGKAYRDALLVLLVSNSDRPSTRFAFVTSRRIGGAVRRNRLRRLMREAARRQVRWLSTGHDVVVIATARAADASYCQVEQSMRSLLQQAGLG